LNQTRWDLNSDYSDRLLGVKERRSDSLLALTQVSKRSVEWLLAAQPFDAIGRHVKVGGA
jgi:hypothetical protein